MATVEKISYSKAQISDTVKSVEASGGPPFCQDPEGYFLIRVNKEKRVIEVGFCERNNVVEILIAGKYPEEIYYAAIREGLITKFDHAAYLGKELQKAYIALKTGAAYVQDSDLEFKK